MNIRDYLTEVATRYDRFGSMADPIQVMLKSAQEYLSDCVPAGMLIRGSGGHGKPTLTPWIGFFDPDETTSPQDGIYIVYLFSEKLDSVCLALMQGITTLTRKLGVAEARRQLALDAATVRHALPSHLLLGFDTEMKLESDGFRQRSYEAGTILCSTYHLGDLPAPEKLQGDLDRVLSVYQHAVEVKRRRLQEQPGSIASPSVLQLVDEKADPLQEFRPKDDSDYVARLSGQELVKSRRHETIVREYGLWVAPRGFRLSTTEHPRDLVLYRDENTWLCEVKVVYQGNATEAVRAALGQLYSYRHFLYRASQEPKLVAIFSEPVGAAYVEFLETCSVRSVWKRVGGWAGSSSAVADGLAALVSEA